MNVRIAGCLLGLAILVGQAGPAAADTGPVSSALGPVANPMTLLTPAQRQLAVLKEQRFQQKWAAQRRAQPSGATAGPGTFAVINPGGSWPQSYSIAVGTRQQEKSYYCGPASTQAVQVYRGGFSAQSTIAVTENTEINLSTNVGDAQTGLNTYVSQPSGFTYLAYQPASDGEWWARLQEDLAGYAMPQVVTVAPHDPGWWAWLPSWPTAVTTGHYVVLSAYGGYNYSDAGSSVNYVDSSAGYGGGTGVWGMSATTMRSVITKGNAQHAPNWIIW